MEVKTHWRFEHQAVVKQKHSYQLGTLLPDMQCTFAIGRIFDE